MTTTPEQIGRTLTRLRRAKQWSGYRLAQEAGVSREHVRKLEAGRVDPTVGMIQKLATALGVSPSTLVGWK